MPLTSLKNCDRGQCLRYRRATGRRITICGGAVTTGTVFLPGRAPGGYNRRKPVDCAGREQRCHLPAAPTLGAGTPSNSQQHGQDAAAPRRCRQSSRNGQPVASPKDCCSTQNTTPRSSNSSSSSEPARPNHTPADESAKCHKNPGENPRKFYQIRYCNSPDPWPHPSAHLPSIRRDFRPGGNLGILFPQIPSNSCRRVLRNLRQKGYTTG